LLLVSASGEKRDLEFVHTPKPFTIHHGNLLTELLVDGRFRNNGRFHFASFAGIERFHLNRHRDFLR
jgi:hypothetical protein